MKLTPIEITSPWLPSHITAITLWPFVFYRRGVDRSKTLRAHERYHWDQALRWGVLPWYITYVLLLLVHRTGGRDHPMEREAYALADRIREAERNAG